MAENETKPVVTRDVSDLTFNDRVIYQKFNPEAVSTEIFEKIQELMNQAATIPQDYILDGRVCKIESETEYINYKTPELVSWKVTIDLKGHGYIYYTVFERKALPEIGKQIIVELPSYLRR